MNHRITRLFTSSRTPEPLAPPARNSGSITSIQWSLIAEAVIALGVILAICYFAKLVWISLMIAVLIAFTLEPLVLLFEKSRISRSLGALLAVFLLLGVIYGVGYFSYNRLEAFIGQLPSYATRLRNTFAHVERQTQQLEQTRENVLPKDQQKAVPVKVKDSGSLFTRLFGAATEAALTLGFIPFLVYFMLTWHKQAWVKTVRLFPIAHRDQVRDALGEISSMMRAFIAGNFAIGLALGIASMAVFGALGLPYFYFLGFISGFLSLVPYLGAILAVAVPLIPGLGTMSTSGILIVVLAVLGLHLLALNVLYPKFIGSRLELNPLVVIVGLLFWGWMWQAMGLILAIPIMAAIKIVCDHVGGLRPVGEWMGE